MKYRYYTPEIIAKIMVDMVITDSLPDAAVDLCVGSWNLLKSAAQRWENIQLVGVDIDDLEYINSFYNASFYKMDGRSFAIECLKNGISFPIVLANPPFGYEERNIFDLLHKLPGVETMTTYALHRIEVTMLLANLALLRDNGYLIAILPQTLFDGEWAYCIRKYLASMFHIQGISRLPANVFKGDIQTSILTLHHRKQSGPCKINDIDWVNKKLQIKTRGIIESDQLLSGLWKMRPKLRNRIEDGVQIIRGSMDNSKLEREGVVPVLHSTDVKALINGVWYPSRFAKSTNFKVEHLEPGDIIMVRVGRNAGSVARITCKKRITISDCLFLIRHENQSKQDRIWHILNSPSFRKHLLFLKQGICINYLASSQVKDYIARHL